jgi:hypothetical protein
VNYDRSFAKNLIDILRGIAGCAVDHGETAVHNLILPWMDGIAGQRPSMLAVLCALQACCSTLAKEGKGSNVDGVTWPTSDECLPDRLRSSSAATPPCLLQWKSRTVKARVARVMSEVDEKNLIERAGPLIIKQSKKALTEAQVTAKSIAAVKKYMGERQQSVEQGVSVGMIKTDGGREILPSEFKTLQGEDYTGALCAKWRQMIIRFAFDPEIIDWRSIRQAEYCFLHKIRTMPHSLAAIPPAVPLCLVSCSRLIPSTGTIVGSSFTISVFYIQNVLSQRDLKN